MNGIMMREHVLLRTDNSKCTELQAKSIRETRNDYSTRRTTKRTFRPLQSGFIDLVDLELNDLRERNGNARKKDRNNTSKHHRKPTIRALFFKLFVFLSISSLFFSSHILHLIFYVSYSMLP